MDFKTNSIQKISYILKFYRRVKRYSQQDMAELIEISHRNYQRIEAGEVEPKLERLGLISKVLNIPVSNLLCSSNLKVLDLSEISTFNEYKNFKEIESESDYLNHSLLFAKMLIEEDKRIKPETIAPIVRVEGDKAFLCPTLREHVGLNEERINIDDHLTFGTCVERWEIVFRNKLMNPIIENTLIFPKGVFVFEEYHYNVSPNPDNPTSECLIRDITNRHQLQDWIFFKKKNQGSDSIKNRFFNESKIMVN